jgi:TldD protein
MRNRVAWARQIAPQQQRRTRSWTALAFGLALLVALPLGASAQQKPLPPEAASDPVLRALQAELTRSKSQLKMDNVDSPFYIEYRVFDVEQFDASAAFGALREQNRTRLRLVRAVVRLGDYKLDSFFNAGQGVSDILPLDNDELAIRHAVWLATDQAYKRAGEAFSNKKAQLKQLNIDQPVDDFAKAEPVVSIGPVARLELDPAKWTKILESATGVYRNDAAIQSLVGSVNFTVVSQYFVNTEGTVTRHGSAHYQVVLSASEQSPDGMRLERSPQFTANRLEELPTPDEIQKDAVKLVTDMKALRGAPVGRGVSRPGDFFKRCRVGHVFRIGRAKPSRTQARTWTSRTHGGSFCEQLESAGATRLHVRRGRSDD